MNLNDLKKAYFNKTIAKAKYTDDMFRVHKLLFEYSHFLKKTDISKIVIGDSRVSMTCRDGIEIICDPNDKRLAPIDALNFNTYEKTELEIAIKLIENNFSVFDIGANVGWYSLHFSKKFPNARILAFEPVKKTFDYLLENIHINGTKNISAYNFGFSEEAGTETFYFRNEESVSASMVDLKDDKKARKIKCKMVCLDDFSSRNNLKIDFIKCDIEGSELLAIKGGRKAISKHKPIIFMEMLRKWSAKFNYHPNELINLLNDMGYLCFKIKNGRLSKFKKMTDLTVETNFFFLHNLRHKDKIKRLAK